MERYYGDESKTRDLWIIMIDIMHYSRFDRVKQPFYSNLCNGKGVRKFRKKIEWQLRLEMITIIETKDKQLFDLLFKDVEAWMTAQATELLK